MDKDKHEKIDKIDRLYERKKFLKIIFNGVGDDEYIRLFQSKDEFSKVTFWKDIDDLNNYVENNRYNTNTYFNLATTDGEAGTTENLKYRYCLAWDFDKKLDNKLDAKDIMFRFKSIGLWYHALIDSGHGYHVYMIINKTNELDKVEQLTKAIGEKLGADPDAMKKTQILRVPLSFNVKDRLKQVNIIKMFDKNSIKPYDIEKLYKKFCNKTSEDRTIQYALNKTKFPPCIVNILKGVEDGNRNFAVLRLISYLKLYKYTESETRNIVKEWNMKNTTPETDSEIEYQFRYIWNKPYANFGCTTEDALIQAQIKQYCNKEECRSNTKGDMVFVEGETLQIEYKLCKKLEIQKKGKLQLKGNHLLLIGVLKNNIEGLTTEELKEKLTYKNKCCLSSKTFSKTLNELADNGYITKIKGNKRKGEKDFCKMNDIKCEEIEKFNLSYFALLGVVKTNISTEDFKIYCYIRYRLKKGFSVTQEKLADQLGISQQAVSLHINNLIKEKYLELSNIDYSSNIFGTNMYKVNY